MATMREHHATRFAHSQRIASECEAAGLASGSMKLFVVGSYNDPAATYGAVMQPDENDLPCPWNPERGFIRGAGILGTVSCWNNVSDMANHVDAILTRKMS